MENQFKGTKGEIAIDKNGNLYSKETNSNVPLNGIRIPMGTQEKEEIEANKIAFMEALNLSQKYGSLSNLENQRNELLEACRVAEKYHHEADSAIGMILRNIIYNATK